MQRAFSYIRFSSLAQAGNDSLRRQTTAAKEWCEANDAELVEDFTDFGVSAFKGRNVEGGALGAFMQLAESGRIPKGSILLVESLDRITRNEITEAVTLFLRIISAGVTLVTLADGQTYDKESVNADASKIFISVGVMMRAHDESKMKSKRVRAAWQAKRKQALEKPISKMSPAWLELRGDKWHVIEKRAKVVRRIFELVCAGKGCLKVCQVLNAENVPTFKRGKIWHSRTVARLIDGRTVLGELQLCEGRKPVGAPLENYYPAIIEPAVWSQAQRVRASHRSDKGGGGKEAVKNVFRGLIFTPEGEPLHAHACRRNNKLYIYLRGHRQSPTGKKTVSWNYDEFKALFIHLVERAREPREPTGDSGAADRIRLEIEAVRAKEDNLALALANGYSRALEDALRSLDGEREKLEERLLGAIAEPVAPQAALIDWRDDERLGENLRSCVKRIVVDAPARAFTVEMLDGTLFSYMEEGDSVIFERGTEVVPFPNAKSRSA